MTDWYKKLLAFLHDPPHKPVRIQDHEDQRASFLNRFGIAPEEIHEFGREADWQAAAADRLIFPDPAKSGLRVDWGESWLEFRHPLGGQTLTQKSFSPMAAEMEEELIRALDAVKGADAEDWPRKFLAGWRLWPEFAARERNSHFAYLVADTRIPDHTLWHHNSLAAAFTATRGKPAFLLFQIGPVQDFIKQARKTQDLWAGSYLLSFLIAQAQLAVADAIGPDCIIYPHMRGNPLADWHWHHKGLLPSQLTATHRDELLLPNLPNRFLALVPADWRDDQGRTLPQLCENAVNESWRAISDSVRDFLEKTTDSSSSTWGPHWDAQVKRFPVIDWVLHPWSDTPSALGQAANATEPLPPLHGGWQNHPLHHAELWARKMIPATEQESWTNNLTSGFAWALHYAITDWKFAAKKNARAFAAWTPHRIEPAFGVPKDHLDGRNEVLGGARHEAFWETLRRHKLLGENTREHPDAERHFVGSQMYGAITVVKRLWARAYLQPKFGFDVPDHLRKNFRSVIEIASGQHEPLRSFWWDETDEDLERLTPDKSYYAVLAMDGDDMGQWVSGTKAPPLLRVLSETGSRDHPQRSPAVYFKNHWNSAMGGCDAEEVQRPLSPGFHVALSEALSNFSLYCAFQIVNAFNGQLIYAGGDDVLAMLPAANALDCAQALQLVLRGVDPESAEARASLAVQRKLKWRPDNPNGLFEFPVSGFIRCKHGAGKGEGLRPNWPLMVMGPLATASVGIAIGHVHSPMQDTIEAARAAESAAKRQFERRDKGALCMAVLKRSGEAAQFAAQWNSGVPGVWSELTDKVHDQSGRFAYRYLQVIQPLLALTGPGNDAGWVGEWTDMLRDAAQEELRHVLHKQANQEQTVARDNAVRWIGELVGKDLMRPALTPRDFVHFWMSWAFVNRLSKPESIP